VIDAHPRFRTSLRGKKKKDRSSPERAALRAVLDRQEENDRSLFKMSEFQKRMKAVGIEITTFSSWAKVDELRLLANTVKHAEGDSAHELHQ
jgi:hypothetical protein